ncbi:MAG: DUF2931 family protein [Chitinophagaceae bacterium]|nr:MAG: DUF2931 family protein [Chitinophagaceae bacterium]
MVRHFNTNHYLLKLNLRNKLYAGISILLLAAIAFKLIHYNAGNRYYYAANVTAPATFPVHVKEGYFTRNGTDMQVHLDTEEVNLFRGNWGKDYFFAEANERNLLPEMLVLKYVSYREGTFYNDTIALPAEKIKTIFEAALKNGHALAVYFKGQDKPGLSFSIGIANDGNIIVWLKDSKGKYEICRKKLTPKSPGREDTYYGEDLSKAAYLEKIFERVDDSLKTLIQSGYDAGAHYIDSAAIH